MRTAEATTCAPPSTHYAQCNVVVRPTPPHPTPTQHVLPQAQRVPLRPDDGAPPRGALLLVGFAFSAPREPNKPPPLMRAVSYLALQCPSPAPTARTRTLAVHLPIATRQGANRRAGPLFACVLFVLFCSRFVVRSSFFCSLRANASCCPPPALSLPCPSERKKEGDGTSRQHFFGWQQEVLQRCEKTPAAGPFRWVT